MGTDGNRLEQMETDGNNGTTQEKTGTDETDGSRREQTQPDRNRHGDRREQMGTEGSRREQTGRDRNRQENYVNKLGLHVVLSSKGQCRDKKNTAFINCSCCQFKQKMFSNLKKKIFKIDLKRLRISHLLSYFCCC